MATAIILNTFQSRRVVITPYIETQNLCYDKDGRNNMLAVLGKH